MGEKFTLAAFDLAEASPPDPPQDKPNDAGETAGKPMEPANSTAPVTIAPISAAPLPIDTIRRTPLALPKPSLANEEIAITASTDAEGFQAQFAKVAKGTEGGQSGPGSGAGGAGGGTGAAASERVSLVASWAPTMDFSKGHEHYPPRARKAGVEGYARLKCFVLRGDRVRNCKLVEESPAGYRFGSAALKTVLHLRVRLHDQHGRRVYNEWTFVTSRFELTDEMRAQLASSQDGATELASNP